ncbi:MAG TPA: neuraminidase-like domain-containing protein, partial [Myxococcota bacterium]|nr:neuraminidase-like domain-containing protein [Myxococcota bacterium]
DLNADRAEDTLLSYLDRLHEVSSLQVLASHVQRESDADGTIDLLHVFARTRSLPTTYWYRRRENSATWTAWERIEAGVQGEHLLPVIYNRRLLLFWGEFTEVGSEEQNPSVPSWWEVRLAMSEYRDGRWSAKKLSADPVSLNSTLLIVPSLNLGAMNRYGLLSSISEDNLLTIRLYGASSASVIALHDLANFEVDPCTMEITGSRTAPTSTDRHALEINYWRSPGFRTVDYDENLDRTDHLAVNLGETDADGEPVGDFAAVSVLGSCFDATVVVPAQWQDFVSQAPFFVNVGARVYFVEPAAGASTVEVDDVGELDEEEGVTIAPAMQALASRRGGTSASASIGSTL